MPKKDRPTDQLLSKLECYLDSKQSAQLELLWLKRELLGHTGQLVSSDEYSILEKAVYERTQLDKPLQYILKSVPFCNLTITVRPPVLIPRPETEEIVTWILQHTKELKKCKDLSIVDVCSGSGCISLALAHHLPHSMVTGLDISPEALSLSNENAVHQKIPNTLFRHSDLFQEAEKSSYDLIVSNPPYLSEKEWAACDTGVTEWEDKKALVTNNNGLFFYEEIARLAGDYLRPSNLPFNLVVEIGSTQKKAVCSLLKAHGFINISCHIDMSGKDRFISALLPI